MIHGIFFYFSSTGAKQLKLGKNTIIKNTFSDLEETFRCQAVPEDVFNKDPRNHNFLCAINLNTLFVFQEVHSYGCEDLPVQSNTMMTLHRLTGL